MRGSLALAWVQLSAACTTIAVGKHASRDGSVLCAHTNDGEGVQDPRLVFVPARDHARGAQRPVFFSPESYPRYVGAARGDIPAYAPTPNHTDFEPIGFIDEVLHTFSYYEETYGAMNEHQLGIAESTCSGVFGTLPKGQGGRALLSVDALTQLAMERTTTSREAVELMGALAEQHGFYGSGSFEGSAESLLVSDPHEAWVFHILPDDTGTSAIWAAQRVPDDHIAVVANAFVIREVDFTDSANFLGSASVHAVALAKRWWAPEDGLLDFTKVYSDGEYDHKFYSGRRVWGVYHTFSPSANFSADYKEWRVSRPYPATAAPDTKVSVEDVQDVLRSFYEGTAFDQTTGLAGGPWGTPDHVVGGSNGTVKGHWERTIGLFRTSDSYVVQSRRGQPGVLWYGAHSAPYTVYVPFVGARAALPKCTLGHPAKLDRSTLFWAVRYLANLAQLKWKAMFPRIRALQHELHAKGVAHVEHIGSGDAALEQQYCDEVVARLFALQDELMFAHADGYTTTLDAHGKLHVQADPYPDWWLRAVGFADGPPDVPDDPPHADGSVVV